MASEMFGSPIGWSQAGKDSDSRLMNALGAAQGLGELAMQPAKQSLAESHARLYGAEADEKQMALEIRRRVGEKMNALGSGTAGGKQEDPADMLEQLGRLHLDAGAYDAGTKYLKEAETYRLRGAREEQAKGAAAHQAMQNRVQQIEMVGAAAGAVTDQASLERFQMQLLQQAADVKDPQQKAQVMGFIQSIPSDYTSAKPVLEQYTQQAIKAAEKIKIEARDVDQKRKQDWLDLRERIADNAEDARKARAEADQERRENIERNRGRASNPNETDQAVAFIKQQLESKHGGKIAAEGLFTGAADLADRARLLMRTNNALRFTQALALSYDSADWEVEKNKLWADTAKLVRPGQSAQRPLPLPADRASLVEGEWYIKDGKVEQWKAPKK